MSCALKKTAAAVSQATQFAILGGIWGQAIKKKCQVESHTATTQAWQLVDDAIKEHAT
jgi:hypothetical protein